MLMKILIGLAVIVVVFVAIVATRPSEFRVARTTTIAAPAPAVFAQVNDFHKWEAWNPWAQIDPAMKQTYEGAPAGRGAIYTCVAEFTFKPEGDRTVVAWNMVGQNGFIAKAVHLFMDMDKMIGGNFEKGLARMKSVVEAAPRAREPRAERSGA